MEFMSLMGFDLIGGDPNGNMIISPAQFKALRWFAKGVADGVKSYSTNTFVPYPTDWTIFDPVVEPVSQDSSNPEISAGAQRLRPPDVPVSAPTGR
jgi:hypothetical protein